MKKAGCKDIPSIGQVKQMRRAFKLEREAKDEAISDPLEEEGQGQKSPRPSKHAKFTHKTKRMIENLMGKGNVE